MKIGSALVILLALNIMNKESALNRIVRKINIYLNQHQNVSLFVNQYQRVNKFYFLLIYKIYMDRKKQKNVSNVKINVHFA